jgi:hypothetical protein
VSRAATASTAELIPLLEVATVKGLPFGSYHTGHLIRRGKLSCIRLGKHVFVTIAILDDYVRRHMVIANEPAE